MVTYLLVLHRGLCAEAGVPSFTKWKGVKYLLFSSESGVVKGHQVLQTGWLVLDKDTAPLTPNRCHSRLCIYRCEITRERMLDAFCTMEVCRISFCNRSR